MSQIYILDGINHFIVYANISKCTCGRTTLLSKIHTNTHEIPSVLMKRSVSYSQSRADRRQILNSLPMHNYVPHSEF